jgi:predicted transcriptional regulator
MSDDNGQAAIHDWREQRREIAWVLRKKGWSRKRVAEVLEVNPRSVSRWVNLAEFGGLASLRSRRPRQWTTDQQDRAAQLIAKVTTETSE